MKDEIKSFFKNNYSQFYEKYLQKVSKIVGNEFKGVCPFHDDTDPSFNVGDTSGQYFCHGCGKKGDIFHFYGKINGLNTKQDFGKILRGIADDFGIAVTQQSKAKIVKVYPYLDEQEKEIYQVCRKTDKSFVPRHKNGNGAWTYNIKGVRRVLYNLPAVLKANEVFIVEGEKDADNLSRLGFTGTTNPGGAKNWRPEYNESLKGKAICLIPDNDPPGREHMTKIAQSLNGGIKSLKWIDLPGLPSKGDVSDFIAGFKDKDEAGERLSILVDQAKPYAPPKKYIIEDVILSTNNFMELTWQA